MAEDPSKECSLCHETKPLTDFYSKKEHSSGFGARCKKCMRTNKALKRERHYRDTNREEINRRFRERRAKKPNEIDRRHYELRRGTVKELCRNRLRNAVKASEIEKPKECEDCGEKSVLHGHHADYTKPLNVTWLCSTCHGLEHRIPLLAQPESPQPDEPEEELPYGGDEPLPEHVKGWPDVDEPD